MLGRSVPGRVLELLSDAAAELTASLPDGRIDIRVAGDDVDMTYVEDDRDRCRRRATGTTCRPDHAAGERGPQVPCRAGSGGGGVSVNTFILRTLERSTSSNWSRSGRAGNRLRGYGTT